MFSHIIPLMVICVNVSKRILCLIGTISSLCLTGFVQDANGFNKAKRLPKETFRSKITL